VAALYSRRANTILGIVIAALAAFIVLAIATPMVLIRTPYGTDQNAPIIQPVAFDHRHHVRDDLIDCLYCHPAAEYSAYAGLPSTELCMGCHGQVWQESAQLVPVRQSWETGKAISWKRVYDLPDHLYFHHGVHVRAGIDCTQCHGDVKQMARVERVSPLTMKWCLDCHREPRGGVDPGRSITQITTCSACHR
jgi:hypothetical protein